MICILMVGMQDIAEHLNSQGVLSPLGHFIEIGVRKLTASMNKDTYMRWTGSKVHSILKNPIYTGDLVQGTTTSYSHKVKKRIPVPKENWIIAKNTHNPIITHSTFNLAQELLQKGTKPVSSPASPSLFSGILTCADCGSQMVRNISIKNGTSYSNYLCSNYKKNGRANCTSHFISEDVIKAVVLDAIRLQIKAYGDISALKQKVESIVVDKGNKENLENKIAALTGRLKSTDHLQIESENDFLSGVIDKQEFQYILKRLNEQKKSLDSQLKSIQREQTEQRHKLKNISDFISAFLQDGEVNQLTRSLIIHLIEEISIYQDKSIRIKFKFQNEFE